MNEKLSDLVWGTLCLTGGTLLLLHLDRIVQLDQGSGAKLNAWFREKLGNSFLNTEIWSIGPPAGHRSSRIGFRVVGFALIITGVMLLWFSLRQYLNNL
jgi:hypothetical protein